jgi:hypothetical protein
VTDNTYFEGANFRLWWDGTHGIGRACARGEIDIQAAELFARCIREIATDQGRPVDWIHDVSEISPPSSKARRILTQATADPGAGRFAFVGASILIRTVVNFISGASGKTNIRHFAMEADALRWLKEGPR